ncbi:ABC transporter ATP-binding protein [Brevundimonas lutea]|uniref:ABC transporter ATP-binding protein n=1 Tax=Brevundimonas lutea TaxID=2293980 RepID=UPI000F012085|nr:ABC transporter ATP-binding protein [Brevundimonas lutea]
MIELVDIEKTYNTRYGVKRVIKPTNLAFYRGASTAVLGLNGAGKSTLLRMIGGVEKPDRGKVVKTVTVSPPLGITNTFNGALTGAENLKFVCRLYDIDIKRAEAFVEDFADLGPYFHEPVRTYSSGMRGRLAFGMSMAVDFQVYLIDEGLSAGDARFRQKSRDAFERRKSRSDIIMTSHNMNTIRDFCTRAVVIDDGNVTPFEDLDAAEEFYMEVVARRR